MSNKKVCVITGSNSGIGKVAAIELAKQGYELAMLVRDSQKSKDALLEIQKSSGSNDVKIYPVNLSSQASINTAIEKIKNDYTAIDILINNAGVFKRSCELSDDGIEMTYAVNYFATFIITNELIPLLKKSQSARIINLSSALYKNGKASLENINCKGKFNGNKVYADTKLLVILFTKELALKLKDTNITVNSLHPGVVATDVFREFPKYVMTILSPFISSPEKGAKATIYLALSDKVTGVTGKYFHKTKQVKTIPLTQDKELSKSIWEKTISILKG